MSRLEDLAVGDELPGFEREINSLQMFRFSAITWNPHKIHYDRTHAQTEGHPDILVQAHLHGALLQELAMDLAGTDGRLNNISWRNVGRATAEATLYVGGEVRGVDETEGRVTLEIWTESNEERCAQGTATVELAQE